MDRRTFLGSVAASVVAARTAAFAQTPPRAQAPPPAPGQAPVPAPVVHKKGVFKQGVTRGVFARGTSVEDCCKAAADLGIKGFDLIGPADWPTLKKYGITPSMYPGGPGGSGVTESSVELASHRYGSRYSYCEWMRRGCIYREAWGEIIQPQAFRTAFGTFLIRPCLARF
jgi:hypothetical protein